MTEPVPDKAPTDYRHGVRYEVSDDENAASLVHAMTHTRIGIQTVDLDFGDEGTARVRIEGTDPSQNLITFERDRPRLGGTEFIQGLCSTSDRRGDACQHGTANRPRR